MPRSLYNNSKIFFQDPYVVRVQYPESATMDDAQTAHRALLKKAYKLISGTYGYSKLEYEEIDSGMINPVWNTPAFKYAIRGYFCFKHKADALQFRLMTDATHVSMWPFRLFTIHDITDDAEE